MYHIYDWLLTEFRSSSILPLSSPRAREMYSWKVDSAVEMVHRFLTRQLERPTGLATRLNQ